MFKTSWANILICIIFVPTPLMPSLRHLGMRIHLLVKNQCSSTYTLIWCAFAWQLRSGSTSQIDKHHCKSVYLVTSIYIAPIFSKRTNKKNTGPRKSILLCGINAINYSQNASAWTTINKKEWYKIKHWALHPLKITSRSRWEIDKNICPQILVHALGMATQCHKATPLTIS